MSILKSIIDCIVIIVHYLEQIENVIMCMKGLPNGKMVLLKLWDMKTENHIFTSIKVFYKEGTFPLILSLEEN